LHSQLAYFERDERPDLFDVKFVRDELLYYSRDENQFLRRRLAFVFALFPDLVSARFKDAGLPWQRIVLVLALLLVAVRKLIAWLSNDSLTFQVLLVDSKASNRLTDEKTLLETLLREEIAAGTVLVENVTLAELQRRCVRLARQSHCHGLVVTAEDGALPDTMETTARLHVNGPRPALTADDHPLLAPVEPEVECWRWALESLLRLWI
jgi:hypothetical protein